MAFGLYGLSSFGGGIMEGLDQADESTLRKLKLMEEKAQVEGLQGLGSIDPNDLSQLYQSMGQPVGPGPQGSMAPPPSTPSVPAQPPPRPQQVASADTNLTGPDRVTLTGDGPQSPDVVEALLKQRLAAGGGQPIGGTRLGTPGIRLAGGYGQPEPPPQPQPPPPPPPQPQPQQQPQQQQQQQTGSGMQGFGGGVDIGRLAALIKQKNPNISGPGLVAALNQANKLLAPESRMQLQYMNLLMRQMQMEETRRHHQATEIGSTGIDEEALGRLGWSPDAIQTAARVWIDTGQMPTNLGTRVVAAQIVGSIKQAAQPMMKAMGLTAGDLPARWAQYGGEKQYQRSAGGFGARVESASNEVAQLIPQALETSKALPRGKFVPFNQLMQTWQRGTSDPAYNDFIMANFSLINAYTRAMNPTGIPRVNDRLEQKAIGILSEATSQEAYEKQVRRLWKEVQASKKAVAQTREGRTGGDVNAPLPGDEPGGGGGGGGEKVIRYDRQGNPLQ